MAWPGALKIHFLYVCHEAISYGVGHLIKVIFFFSEQYRVFPASILYKSIAGRYRPVSYPDGPITARYRFIKNAMGCCVFMVVPLLQLSFLFLSVVLYAVFVSSLFLFSSLLLVVSQEGCASRLYLPSKHSL